MPAVLINKLKQLSPTAFENVAYDLAVSAGLQNAVWRTPGSDGGRDIEGEYVTTDFSGHRIVQKWYIECKRYATSVDWPTLWQKISYADNHGADSLLLVTTAHVSPQCRSELTQWNAQRRRPTVRVWDAANFEATLEDHPRVLVKHALVSDVRRLPPSFLPLARRTANVLQAAYGHAVINDQPSVALDAAAALAELLTSRMTEAESGLPWKLYPFDVTQDGYDWLAYSDGPIGLEKFDKYGLRALLSVLRLISGVPALTASTANLGQVVVVLPAAPSISPSTQEFLSEITAWANVELTVSGAEFVMKARVT